MAALVMPIKSPKVLLEAIEMPKVLMAMRLLETLCWYR